MDLQLLNLEDVLRRIGRGVVFYAVDGDGEPIRWDPGTEMNLVHLGDTEGNIVVNANGEQAVLTLPEIAGSAVFEATYLGENPVVEIPLFLADPALLPIVSPIGNISAGHIRVRDVSERTLVIFPEKLFRLPGGQDEGFGMLSFAAGAWSLGGAALTDAQDAIMAMSMWFWRGFFSRPSRSFLGGHGDEGKNIETVSFQAMMHPDMPDGHRLYTLGDPALSGINLEGGS